MISSSLLRRVAAHGAVGLSRQLHAKTLSCRAATSLSSSRFVRAPAPAFTGRSFSDDSSSSSSSSSSPSFMPDKLTADMAQGICDVTHFYIHHGLAQRRLQALAAANDGSVLSQWQSMIEIYLGTQLHVLAGMGYANNDQSTTPQETGLAQYAQDLATLLTETDDATRDVIVATRRETWRELVATAFGFSADDDIPNIGIVEARELMHAVSSRMVEPDLLLMIQSQTAKVDDPDPEVELQMKHQILQEVIVNNVYLGQGSSASMPSITEKFGFGTGPQAYAKLQCAMSDYEGDPLIGQYAASAMTKLFAAAGLDSLLGEDS